MQEDLSGDLIGFFASYESMVEGSILVFLFNGRDELFRLWRGGMGESEMN